MESLMFGSWKVLDASLFECCNYIIEETIEMKFFRTSGTLDKTVRLKNTFARKEESRESIMARMLTASIIKDGLVISLSANAASKL